MTQSGAVRSRFGLAEQGIRNYRQAYWNLPAPTLYEEALRRGEGVLGLGGALAVETGQYTGRSPNDKFIVEEQKTKDSIWWGPVNRPFSQTGFDSMHKRMLAYFQGRDLFVRDVFAGADPEYRLPVRIITEQAWHNLFAANMFLTPGHDELQNFEPAFTILQAPGLHAVPEQDGTKSEAFILVDFSRRLVLIGGSRYAGEIKKSVFSVLNYFLPEKGVLPMHCSANIGPRDDTAIFFGLSGTGKTTLSADGSRKLIGDDEHGWSDRGVFNFEGGCYAKVIRLSPQAEPEIYATTSRFGTILENVVIDPDTRALHLDDASMTENTRGSYPIDFIDNAEMSGRGGHPKNVIMLTADAYGVLPPIARLSSEAAMYHFLSGYTARVAGTEKGVTEPKATFSTCFGAPFLPLNPNVYAQMLGERIAKHGARVWLVNTGWTGGAYGVGKRMKIGYTRAMITAALTGQLDDVKYQKHPVFNLDMPTTCPGVPASVLDPRSTWPDAAQYDEQARKLAKMFIDNFVTFEKDVPASVKDAGPKL